MDDYSGDVKSKVELTDILRKDISDKAGDTLSILGTAADAVQLLLYELSKLVADLSSVQSIDDVRNSAESLNSAIGGFYSRVDSGEVRLPYKSKEFETVIGEIEHRATAVADVIDPSE